MGKPISFYTYHLLGWGLFGVINFTVRAIPLGWTWAEFVSTTILMTIGMLGSAPLRKIYRHLADKSMNVIVLLISVFGICVLDALVICVVVFSLVELMAQPLYGVSSVFSFPGFLVNLANVTMLIVLWSAIYFAIKRYRRHQQLKQEQQQLNSSMKEATLETLINQLNPHFMFNTINNIRALILEDKHKARDMLTHLADMYRYSLNSEEEHLVPLRQELKMVDDYLQLMSIQLEDRLAVEYSIAEDCQQVLVPRMMLQLLVENGIKYGIANRKQGGCLGVSAQYTPEKGLLLTVKNPGSIDTQTNIGTGVGLKNIRKRLTLLYGEQASIKLESDKDIVTVELVIPWSESHD